MDEWHDFYLMLGPAAASLIGLLFVVATLSSGIERESVKRGTKAYSTPTVFHLGVVVLLSGLCLEPDAPTPLLQIATIASALAGLAYSAFVGWAFKSDNLDASGTDFLFYAVGVALLYLVLAAAGVTLTASPQWGPYLLASDLLILLLLLVRNSWDLVTWIAPKQNG